MEPISEKLKLIYLLVIRQIRKIFFVLPIKKNRVMFESFSGDSYGCNAKYISIMLKEKYGDIEIQTWHGGCCYKKIGNEEKARGIAYIIRRNIQELLYVCDMLITDYSSSI